MISDFSKFGQAEELEISPLGEDGQYLKPVIIWGVLLGENLYVRSYRGSNSKWYQNALTQRKGRIRVGKTRLEVSFAVPEPDIHEQLDQAYRQKYQRYPSTYVESITHQVAREATLQLKRIESDN